MQKNQQYALILLIVLCVLQSSCGFRSIYDTSHAESLPDIHIMPINSINGSELYRHLLDIIDNVETARLELHIKLDYTISNLAIATDSTVMQQNIMQRLHYTLLDTNNNTNVTSGTITSFGVCNTMFGPYTSYIEERQIELNLAREAAGEIQSRLMMYFANSHHM